MRSDVDERGFSQGRTPFGAALARQAEADTDDPRDQVLTHLASVQGWGLPETGSSTDVDERVAGGWIESFRGVRPSRYASADDQAADLAGDPDFVYGSGIYGNGIYFSGARDVADAFAAADPDSTARPGVIEPGDVVPGGRVVRVAINPDARVVDHAELAELGKAWLLQHGLEVPLSMSDAGRDPGRLAAMLGYDVIRVTGMQDGHWRRTPNGGKVRSKSTQYVVLNRGAMIVEEVS